MTYTTHTNKTEAQTGREIVREFERWNNQERGAVGKFDFPAPPGVGDVSATVRFELRGTAITVSCSSQYTYRQNLRCVFFAVEAMRLNEKRGIADTLRRAYMQLDAPKEQRDAYEIMGLRPDVDMETVDDVYRLLAKRRHPDTGGTTEAMQELNDAYARIKEERGVAA